MLFDSHCHLSHEPLVENLPEILAQAAHKHINGFLVPATQPPDWEATLQLAKMYTQIHAAIGIHPWYISACTLTDYEKLEQLLGENSDLLLGEIGLDFVHARDAESRQHQIQRFEQQLDIAKSASRPIIIHHVHATAACLNSIKRCAFKHGGFAHAFSGSLEEAQEWIKQGFLIGIGSLLLRPHAKKARLAAQTLPLEHMVIETDAPYMPPQDKPYNSPANLQQIAQIIAELRGIAYEQVARITTQNAMAIINKIH